MLIFKMKKNLDILKKFKNLQEKINNLDKNKIYLIYFDYSICFKNVYHSPLMLTTKFLSFIANKKDIDHICHISRFVFDNEAGNFEAKVFEAGLERGMEENTLMDKLEHFKGKVYIEELNYVDKVKAKAFESKYLGVEYSKTNALFSGINLTKFSKRKELFCSALVGLFLQDQGYLLDNIQEGNPYEMTPSDIFEADLGKKQLLFKQ
jgi:hypothetical protein